MRLWRYNGCWLDTSWRIMFRNVVIKGRIGRDNALLIEKTLWYHNMKGTWYQAHVSMWIHITQQVRYEAGKIGQGTLRGRTRHSDRLSHAFQIHCLVFVFVLGSCTALLRRWDYSRKNHAQSIRDRRKLLCEAGGKVRKLWYGNLPDVRHCNGRWWTCPFLTMTGGVYETLKR